MGLQGNMDTYLIDPLFNMNNNQMLGNLAACQNMANQEASLAMVDFASMFASGGSFDFDGRVGAMPAMDNDTMTMWSMAPTSLEYVVSFVTILALYLVLIVL